MTDHDGAEKSSSPYSQLDWRAMDRSARTATWKQAVYRALRPAISWEAMRHLSVAARTRWGIDWAFCRRGFPLEERRRFALAGVKVRDATLLVQGTGTGWDVVSWAELRPKRIIAVDAWSFEPSWTVIARHCRDALGVTVEFRVAPVENCADVASASIDLCVSDAVLEHVRDLPAMLAETRRVMHRNGRVYAGFGPLWFAPGGDHFAARAPLVDVYAHVDRSADEYAKFFARHRLPVEDFQSGGRYVELDLFSKLTVEDYLRDFRAAGLRTDAVVAEVCPLAIAYERAHPEGVRALLARYGGRVTRDDLRTKALIVRLAHA